MGLRFRKSFKIMPGVRINLSTKSAGIRIGGKHGGVSLNSRSGVRASASIPGTGLSYSTKVGGKSRSKKKESSKSKKTTPVEYSYQPISKAPSKITVEEIENYNEHGPALVLGLVFGIFALAVLFAVLLKNFGSSVALLVILILVAAAGVAWTIISFIRAKPDADVQQPVSEPAENADLLYSELCVAYKKIQGFRNAIDTGNLPLIKSCLNACKAFNEKIVLENSVLDTLIMDNAKNSLYKIDLPDFNTDIMNIERKEMSAAEIKNRLKETVLVREKLLNEALQNES